MRLVIVTGMSGAGKSSVLKMLEDAGYYCVDNLPVPLVGKFAELITRNPSAVYSKAALGIDVRSSMEAGMEEIGILLDAMSAQGIKYEILFLDCDDHVLIKRYKETRRQHPLAVGGRIEEGIAEERKRVRFMKERAAYIIDTSQMLIRDLKGEVDKIFVKNEPYQNFFVTVLSFGFKYGIPEDADLVFDVRFLPNPYYVESLKKKTGNDQEVKNYVMDSEESKVFLDKLEDLVTFLIPQYINEGKNQLVIGIGCTGGKHRSVTVANALHERLLLKHYNTKVWHRDIDNDSRRNK